MSDISTDPQVIKDDEIDLVALVKTIYNGRKTIYKTVGICFVIGLLVAFLSPVKYQASATLLPSAENSSSSSMGGLSALAGMAGVNLSSMMGNSAAGIPVDIYPQVVESYPFKKEFAQQKFKFKDFREPISLYDYVVADTIPSIGEQVIKYTIKLPWTIIDGIRGKKVELLDTTKYGVVSFTKEDEVVYKSMEGFFSVSVDEKSALISVAAEDNEPILVAQKVQAAVDLLQKYVLDYKTKKQQANLVFLQDSYEESKVEYEASQKAFFNYKDQHRNLVQERVDFNYEQLSQRYDIASSIYSSLAQQVEQAKITLKQETPVFTILEPVKIPKEKSSPKRGRIVIVSLFLGLLVGIGIVLFKKMLLVKFKE